MVHTVSQSKFILIRQNAHLITLDILRNAWVLSKKCDFFSHCSWFHVLGFQKIWESLLKALSANFWGFSRMCQPCMPTYDFDDETFLKFPKFLEIHRSFVRDRPVILVWKFNAPRNSQPNSNSIFEEYFPKFGGSVCQLRWLQCEIDRGTHKSTHPLTRTTFTLQSCSAFCRCSCPYRPRCRSQWAQRCPCRWKTTKEAVLGRGDLQKWCITT